MKLKNAGKFYGFMSAINSSGELVLKLRNPITLNGTDKPLSGITILLDPGHGGKASEGGAVGTADAKNNAEKTANLTVALQLEKLLKEKGATVYMTRREDTVNDRDETVRKLQTGQYDLFLSIHHNGSYKADFCGPETLYYYAFNQGIAKVLNDTKLELLYDANLRPHVARDDVYQSVQVLRTHTCLSVLTEIGFMTCAQNAEDIQEWTNNGSSAKTLLEGILRYLSD